MSGHPPVRVGLIGAGSIARAHAIAYASARTYCGPEVPQVRLVRLADVDEALAKAAAARLGFEAWTTDWEEVVASPDVDLVSIVTPNFLHAPMAIAAAAAGKHVLLREAAGRHRRRGRAHVPGRGGGRRRPRRQLQLPQGPRGAVHRPAAPRGPHRRGPAAPRGLPPGLGERGATAALVEVRGRGCRRRRARRGGQPRDRPGPAPGGRARAGRRDDGDLDRGAPGRDDVPRLRGGARRDRDRPGRRGRQRLRARPVRGRRHRHVRARAAARPGGRTTWRSRSTAAAGRSSTTTSGPTRCSSAWTTTRRPPASAASSWARRRTTAPCWPSPASASGSRRALSSRSATSFVAVAGGPPMTPDFYDGWRALAVAEAVLAAADRGWVTVPPPPARGA